MEKGIASISLGWLGTAHDDDETNRTDDEEEAGGAWGA